MSLRASIRRNTLMQTSISLCIYFRMERIQRLGVSVSKKVGNSIVRHRLARLIREAFRLNVTQVAPGYDIVVIARAGLKGKGYKETESAMLHLLKLHHIYNKEEKVHEESDH